MVNGKTEVSTRVADVCGIKDRFVTTQFYFCSNIIFIVMADANIGVNMEGTDKKPVSLHTLEVLKVSGELLVMVNNTSQEEGNSSSATALLSL